MLPHFFPLLSSSLSLSKNGSFLFLFSLRIRLFAPAAPSLCLYPICTA
ncbi:hypothetical protein HMPREF1986_00704 [Oribacterium sp. oral taxon 078 str. F0263]|nr:hypothetical protein HMPREF1986_00704 [Oribacterium sp. oral taxon 078 str. F0263]